MNKPQKKHYGAPYSITPTWALESLYRNLLTSQTASDRKMRLGLVRNELRRRGSVAIEEEE